MIVTISIDGPATAKGRPRMSRRGIAYTPAATRKYEAHGRLAAQLAMDGRPPITGPVAVVMSVELPIPASWSGKRRAAAIVGDIRPTSRPDIDNYAKCAADAINGIVIHDDSQIVELDARKVYSVAPKLIVTVSTLPVLGSNERAAA
jgi:Holliday junction resolvase RusA-like endonuclease